jgi:bifunctional ADP-heptose synthase (sugar kinase/adenylyltransferase)
MVTRGEKGMTICTREKTASIPTVARDVADVSGAGDTVISTFVATELGGADVIQAATLANIAAGIVCEQVGVVPIDSDRLASAYEQYK